MALFLYSFCPMFVAVETAASMAEPRLVKPALVLAYALPALAVYLPTGLTFALAWGAAVPNPVTSALPPGGLSAAANGMLLYCTLLDFVISATSQVTYSAPPFAPWHHHGLFRGYLRES